MTRKRFIKLLMARGFSRNEATNYARIYLPAFGSYSSLYIKWMIDNFGSYGLSEALNRLLEAAAKAIREIILDLNVTYCPYAESGLMEVTNETRDED